MHPRLARRTAAVIRTGLRLGEPGYRVANGLLGRVRRSKTGYANPRVSGLVHRIGYAWHSYQCSKPNLAAWVADRRPIFPHVVQVQTINRCNAACEFCPYPETVAPQPRRVMTDETWRKIAVECAGEPTLRSLVPMSKNEPLLDAALDRRIAEFDSMRQPQQIVEVVTNGSALTPERARSLADAGVDLLTVSVNAANATTYERVMKGLSWERLTRHLDALAAADLPSMNVYLRFTEDLTNSADIVAFRRRWPGLNLFGFTINNRGGLVRGFERLKVRRPPGLDWLRRTAGTAIYPVCPYAFALVHVLENGDVPFCANDWGDREILGNVADASIRELFNSPRMNELRELMLAGRYDDIEPCRECSFYHEFWRDSPAQSAAPARRAGSSAP